MPIVFASLQHVKLSINVKIPVTLWQIVYINIKFDLKNKNFAKLMVAQLLRAILKYQGDYDSYGNKMLIMCTHGRKLSELLLKLEKNDSSPGLFSVYLRTSI